MVKRFRMWLAHTLLWLTHRFQWWHYATWLLFHWSLVVASHVTESQRAAALVWLDKQGALWGFCAWPRQEAQEKVR